MSFRSPSRRSRVKGRGSGGGPGGGSGARASGGSKQLPPRMEVDMLAQQPPECYIVRLPLELILRIFSYLDVSSMAAMAQTCRAMNQIPWYHIDLTSDTMLQTTDTMWDFLTSPILRYLLSRRPTVLVFPCRDKSLTGNTTRVLDEEESSCLSRLGLFHNQLTPGSQVHFLSYLSRTRPPLTELDLGDNKLSLDACVILGEYASKGAPALRRLSVDGCSLEKNSLCAILNGLKRHTAIKYLSLGANEIQDEVAGEVFATTTCAVSIEVLELRVNSIGEDRKSVV